MLVSIKIYFIISCAFVILIDIDLSRLQTGLVDIYYHIARLDNPIWRVLSFSSKHDLYKLFASTYRVEVTNLCQVSAICQWYCMSLLIFVLNAVGHWTLGFPRLWFHSRVSRTIWTSCFIRTKSRTTNWIFMNIGW